MLGKIVRNHEAIKRKVGVLNRGRLFCPCHAQHLSGSELEAERREAVHRLSPVTSFTPSVTVGSFMGERRLPRYTGSLALFRAEEPPLLRSLFYPSWLPSGQPITGKRLISLRVCLGPDLYHFNGMVDGIRFAIAQYIPPGLEPGPFHLRDIGFKKAMIGKIIALAERG